MNNCSVCKEDFEDGWDHALSSGDNKHPKQGILYPKDKEHAIFMKKVADKLYHGEKCFCGGTIVQYGHGEDSWETTCNKCDFLWDED